MNTPRKTIKISVGTHGQLLALRNRERVTIDAVIEWLLKRAKTELMMGMEQKLAMLLEQHGGHTGKMKRGRKE